MTAVSEVNYCNCNCRLSHSTAGIHTVVKINENLWLNFQTSSVWSLLGHSPSSSLHWTGLVAKDGLPRPTWLTAETLNSWLEPSFSPVSVNFLSISLSSPPTRTKLSRPTMRDSRMYSVTSAPPSYLGGLQATEMESLVTAVMIRSSGRSGTAGRDASVMKHF